MEQTPSEEVLTRLVDSHRSFLGFLERRLGDRALAEDILQDAFVKSIEKGGELRDDNSAMAWFYRLSATPSSTTDDALARATALSSRSHVSWTEPLSRRTNCVMRYAVASRDSRRT